ncbi:MAG: hypothetical protein AAF658_02565 [Myxococcota bacterium]
MTTDEIEIRTQRRRITEQKLEAIGNEFSDSQTMQLTPEHLAMLNELADTGNTPRDEFDLSDTQPVSVNDTQPILIGADRKSGA